MDSGFKELYTKDMSRYRGNAGREMRGFHYWLRKTQTANNPVLKRIYRRMLLRINRKKHMEISDQTKIGAGFCVVHPVGITINPRAVLGKKHQYP